VWRILSSSKSVNFFISKSTNCFSTLKASATADFISSYWKLLDEALRVVSGFEVPDELHDSSSLKSAPTHVGSKSFTSSSNRTEFVRIDDGCSQWLQALDRLLPGALVHNAPMVSGSLWLMCLFWLLLLRPRIH